MSSLDIRQLQAIVTSFIQHSRGSLHLAEVFANVREESNDRDHPFAAPPSIGPLEWCICGRCDDMCSQERMCVVVTGCAAQLKNILEQQP